MTWSGGGPFSIYPKFLVDTFAQTTVPGANSLGAAQSSSSGYGGIVTLDPAQNKASICLTLSGLYDTEVSSAPGKVPGLITLMVPDLVDRMRGTLGCIDVSLTSDFTIPNGSRTASFEQVQFKLEWTKFEPVSAPTTRHQGRNNLLGETQCPLLPSTGMSNKPLLGRSSRGGRRQRHMIPKDYSSCGY